jgi:hypothetical protein
MLASVTSGVARADNYTADQLRVIGKIYQWSRYYGADTALMLRIAYRETAFGLDKQGDGGHSVGVFQWWDKGVWNATPCAKLGLAARWNEDADISCAAWAFSRGYASHWRPEMRVRWLAVVPSDPR